VSVTGGAGGGSLVGGGRDSISSGAGTVVFPASDLDLGLAGFSSSSFGGTLGLGLVLDPTGAFCDSGSLHSIASGFDG